MLITLFAMPEHIYNFNSYSCVARWLVVVDKKLKVDILPV